MKRALIFSLNYYPFIGGAEVALREITDRIPSDEIEFHAIVYRFDSSTPRVEKVGNIIVHRVGFGKKGMTVEETFKPVMYLGKILYVPLATVAALRLNRKLRFDLFWAMMCYMTFPITLLRVVGVRVPYVLTLQEGDPFERVFERARIRVVAPLLKAGFKNATAVQAISTFLLNWARTAGFTGDGRVIPNGVDTTRFAREIPSTEIDAMRETLGKGATDVYLVTTSRLLRKNAVDIVIRALALLPANVSFLIYGKGPDEPALRVLAREQQVEDRVRFMGQIGHDEMPVILRACDIFVRPSRSEGMGNSFIEAMAAGLPVIATQEGGIADFLFDEERNPGKPATGWAVDVDAPEQIAAAVRKIMDDPAKAARVVETAKALALRDYDWDSIAARMRDLFRSLTV